MVKKKGREDTEETTAQGVAPAAKKPNTTKVETELTGEPYIAGSSSSSSSSETNEKEIDIFELLKKEGIEIADAQEVLRKILSKKTIQKKDKEKIEKFKQLFPDDVLKDITKILLPFADPTFDTTFKMLFGSKEHDNILISLLNNLLDLDGAQKITALEIITETLETPVFSYEKHSSSAKGAVDVLCETANGHKIAVEMQRAKQPYFLARTQHYMSKLISVQVNEGSGEKYHEEVRDTYILILAKNNLFTGKHELFDKNDTNATKVLYNGLYEIDVEPVVKQTGRVFPKNKMHWKFYELSKFKEHDDYKILNEKSILKHQWLEFLIDCGNQLQTPNRDNIIKNGYDIMKMMKWQGDLQNLYWKEQIREHDAEQYQKELIAQAEARGEAKGLINTLATLVKLGLDAGTIANNTAFTLEQVNKLLEDLEHISENASKMLGYDYNICSDTIAETGDEGDLIGLIGEGSDSGSDGDLM